MQIIEQKDEKYGKDEIILTVYKTEQNDFTYSIQCRLGRFIRAIYPHAVGETWPTPLTAKRAAVHTLRAWTKKSRATKERLRGFDLLAVEQMELPF